MATTAVHASDVPNFNQAPENAAYRFSPSRFIKAGVGDDEKHGFKSPKFLVIGHRGCDMNMLNSSDEKMKLIKENSILSFNAAADYPIDLIEFDVQVTRDGHPVIFHDNFILTIEKEIIVEKRVTELTLSEFLSYGPQKESGTSGCLQVSMGGKPLFRRAKDGRIFEWKIQKDDPLCTLQDAFDKVDNAIGFNIELKFDDNIVYKEEELVLVLESILKVVNENASGRLIIFSSFQPDAANLIRKLQKTYPVFFLTNGGSEIYTDTRRNSLDEAISLCLEGGLQGIVSEVRAILRDPIWISRIKSSNLSLITYGQLNNVEEVVYVQHVMGVDGVIVDLVKEITEAVLGFDDKTREIEEKNFMIGEENKKLGFSKDQISLLPRLVLNSVNP